MGGLLSVGTLLLTLTEAPRLWHGLTGPPALPVVAVGMLLAPASGLAVWHRRFRWARLLGAGQVALLLVGWALAQWPFIIYPDVTLTGAAAPTATLRFVLWTLPVGMGLLLPSLWFLFAVFKGRNPSVGTVAALPPAGHPPAKDGA